MNTVADLDNTTEIAPRQTKAAATKAAAAPRIRLASHGFCLDHPDPELGERLMADAHLSGPNRGAQSYRNNGAPAITVQNVSIQDGGNAIVGHVTQHASVILSDMGRATAVTDA